MISSGVTAKATVSDAVVELLAAKKGSTFRHLLVINEGAEPGFYRIGTGPFNRLPAASFILPEDGDIQITNQAVEIKRVAGGSDMSGVFGSAW